ncbi:MAG: hydrogenase maturation protease [Chloroflexota bacterium]
MILVIGYGNSLCGDDGIGPYVVEWLAANGATLENGATVEHVEAVEYLVLRQLTPELIESISFAQTVIFIDAALGNRPGEFFLRELSPAIPYNKEAPGAFSHFASPINLLETAESLYGRRPIAYLYSITGLNFDLGSSFSAPVEAALPQLLGKLKSRIALCTSSALPKR